MLRTLWAGYSRVLPLAVAVLTGSVSGAFAAERSATADPVALPTVEVRALREPVEKSYRQIVSGMQLFEARRSLAPSATLRFKLLPRRRDTIMKDVTLSIVGDTVDIPVPIAPDNTFSLELDQRAFAEDALVTPNRQTRSLTWRTEIRTPGLPADSRRLGDLRLECLVGIEAELISDPRPLLGPIARLVRGRGYCDRRDVQYLFFAERPVWSVTLLDGARREVLPVDQLYAGISRHPMTASELAYCDCEVLIDRTYYAPLGDRSWSDDTLLVFDYMDAPTERVLP